MTTEYMNDEHTASADTDDVVLEVSGLSVTFPSDDGPLPAVPDRLRAYAVYVLTRNGTVTTQLLATLAKATAREVQAEDACLDGRTTTPKMRIIQMRRQLARYRRRLRFRGVHGLEIGDEFAASQVRLPRALALLDAADELLVKPGLLLLEPRPRHDPPVQAVAHVAQGHGLPLGPAFEVALGPVGPERLGLFLAGHPFLYRADVDYILHLVAPQRLVGGGDLLVVD